MGRHLWVRSFFRSCSTHHRRNGMQCYDFIGVLLVLSMVQPLRTFCVKKDQIYFDQRSSVSLQVICELNKRRKILFSIKMPAPHTPPHTLFGYKIEYNHCRWHNLKQSINCIALSTANIELNCTPEPNPSYIQIQRKSARIGIETDSDVALNYLNETNFEVYHSSLNHRT